LPVGVDRPLEDGLRASPELLRLQLLLRERLDDVDADDVLLGHRGDVRDLLLHIAQDRMRDAAVSVGEDDQRGGDRHRDEGEPPFRPKHDRRRPDDREEVLGEEDEAVAEEEADALEVDRRPGHQLARLVAIVEAE
jgi:hypothetical protein